MHCFNIYGNYKFIYVYFLNILFFLLHFWFQIKSATNFAIIIKNPNFLITFKWGSKYVCIYKKNIIQTDRAMKGIIF